LGEVTIDKREAAQRLLCAGIVNFFNGEHWCAVHVMAQAAFQVLRDLAEKSRDCEAHQWTLSQIRPGKEREFFRALNKAASFLKHADRDDADVLTVDDRVNDYTLFFACRYHDTLGFSQCPEVKAFTVWFAVTNPDLVNGWAGRIMAELVGDIAHKARGEQLASNSCSCFRSIHLLLPRTDTEVLGFGCREYGRSKGERDLSVMTA
jgi:hypothetical protein